MRVWESGEKVEGRKGKEADRTSVPVFDCWLAYPEEMKNVARVQAFRDFLVANAPLWRF